MPREIEYWRRRNLGICVECPNICTTARCDACNEKRRLFEDRTAGRDRRETGQLRRLASHLERREERRSYLRLGHRQGMPVSQEVIDRIESENAIQRQSCHRPRDGLIPCGLVTLDGIDIEEWTIRGERWRWPESFDRIDLWLGAAPKAWRERIDQMVQTRFSDGRWQLGGQYLRAGLASLHRVAIRRLRSTAMPEGSLMPQTPQQRRARYWKRRESGICLRCDRLAKPGKPLCAGCQVARREYQQKTRAVWKRSGICIRCGKRPATQGRSQCDPCERLRVKYQRRTLDSGQCRYCGSQSTTGQTSCELCRQTRARKARERYRKAKDESHA